MMASVDDTFTVAPCRFGADGHCFTGTMLAVGVTAINGAPLIARCVGTDVGSSTACRALLQLEQQ